MPPAVVGRARDILQRLEEDNQTRLRLDDLPLFAFERTPQQAVKGASRVETLLKSVDPDELSPKEALEVIYNLRRALKD